MQKKEPTPQTQAQQAITRHVEAIEKSFAELRSLLPQVPFRTMISAVGEYLRCRSCGNDFDPNVTARRLEGDQVLRARLALVHAECRRLAEGASRSKDSRHRLEMLRRKAARTGLITSLQEWHTCREEEELAEIKAELGLGAGDTETAAS